MVRAFCLLRHQPEPAIPGGFDGVRAWWAGLRVAHRPRTDPSSEP